MRRRKSSQEKQEVRHQLEGSKEQRGKPAKKRIGREPKKRREH